MHDHKTILTERGQVSVPAELREQARLQPGQHLIWELISPTEFRVTVSGHAVPVNPLAALGFARQFRETTAPYDTDAMLALLRAGDTEEDPA